MAEDSEKAKRFGLLGCPKSLSQKPRRTQFLPKTMALNEVVTQKSLPIAFSNITSLVKRASWAGAEGAGHN